MENFDTLTQAMEILKNLGYVEDFNLKQDCIECRQGQFKIFHDEFEIDKVYRFEVMTDPGDQSYFTPFHQKNTNSKAFLSMPMVSIVIR